MTFANRYIPDGVIRDLPDHEAMMLHSRLRRKLGEAAPPRSIHMFAFPANREACAVFLEALAKALREKSPSDMEKL